MSQLRFPGMPAPRRSPYHPAELKSALQKYIRRAEADKACAAAAGLVAVGAAEHLRRRLAIIAVEDVGWQWMTRVRPLPAEQVYTVTNTLARLPKNKEAGWLSGLATAAAARNPLWDPVAFAAALKRGDHIDAARAASLAAAEAGRLNTLRWMLSDGRPPFTCAIIRSCLGLMHQLLPGDHAICLAAAVIASIERLDREPAGWPQPLADEPQPLQRADWYCFDAHTWRGRGNLARLAQHLGRTPDYLADLMFFFESCRLGPSEYGRWKQEAFAQAALDCGWGTAEAGRIEWERIRPSVQAAIEANLR